MSYPRVVLGVAASFASLLLSSAAHAAPSPCVGDCDGDGQVTVDELVTGTSIALDTLPLSACEAFDTDGSGTVTVDELTTAVAATLDGCPSSVMPAVLTAWVVNSDGERSQHIFTDSSHLLGALVDVESVSLETDEASGDEFAVVRASGIPSYVKTLSDEEIDELNDRPQASMDFRNGQTTAVAGEPIQFGEDIGYDSSNRTCLQTGGDGYWPPGPDCPIDRAKEGHFPLVPQPNESGSRCETGLGVNGYWINGVSVFNWYDGQSYNNQRVWQNLAPLFEVYDLDICAGHGANGEYHHHSYSNCLADLTGDDGQGHSPIYGFMADGYPIYGPWETAGVLATSSWVTRDYDAPSSPTGCGVAGERTCLLVDQYDVSRGTEDAPSDGPNTSETVRTQSGNLIDAVSGVYFQDYYHDPSLTALGGEYLDEHNGHFDEEHGYHYHVTATQDPDTGALVYAFPGTTGPSYYGILRDNAVTACGGMMPRP